MSKVEEKGTPVETTGVEEANVSNYKVSRFQRFKDSWKPADFPELHDPTLTDLEKAALATARSPLQQHLKSRHLQMIAIGGSIGTGLFVGSGGSLSVSIF